MTHASPYEKNLGQNPANYVPLSPLSFLERTASVYPNRTAVIHGDLRRTWAETFTRCRRLASALCKRGIAPNDTVAFVAPNIPAALEGHFGVPMAGAVLNMINTRLDAETIAFILDHGEAKVLVVDSEFAEIVSKALQSSKRELLVVDIDDEQAPTRLRIGDITYEELLASGDPDFDWRLPDDEWQALALNYTSGTTGDPKGVVYHHRGAYLNAIGNVLTWSMPMHPVYLWTLPMFHCNGWCFPWTVTVNAGTHVCLRRVEPKAIFDSIADNRVTHMCGAPIVMNMLVNAPHQERRPLEFPVNMMTAGAAPPAAVLERMKGIGFEPIHVYGLTEVYGPVTVCAWQDDWTALGSEAQAAQIARQGVKYPVLEGLMVGDPDTLRPVPSDGTTIGEVFMRGNVVMRGYFKNERASDEAFAGGWFHTGDLGVVHGDGYIEIKDRSKDIIISGGENISTIEVEGVLYKHPAIAEAAVVARPDEKWGETPCAFVTLKTEESAEAEDIIEFCRERMARYKCPKTVIFTELPKTSTGKIQKYVLRERARELE